MIFQVIVSPQAQEAGGIITDRRIRQKLYERAMSLTQDPEKQGKPMTDELTGFRSVCAVGQRYRIVYRVRREEGIVEVAFLGIRNEGSKQDVYTLAAKLIRQGLIPSGRL